MPRSVEEIEVDRTEVELLGSSSERPRGTAEPLIRRREAGEEVYVPRTKYRFNYREPERLSVEEARRRRVSNLLAAAQSTPVSGRLNKQNAFKLSEASAADARAFHPGKRVLVNPRTLFGTEAYTFMKSGLRRHFLSPLLAIPCVQRVVRREVMFAKRKAAKGYRVPHVRSLLSNIGC